MSIKQVISYDEAEEQILRAVRKLSDPIRQTLGPKGGNVIIQTDQGEVFYTNDGVTIARHVNSSDPTEDAIIQLVKQASMKTNSEAGDGTSTTILLSSILIEEGMKMVRGGMNHMDVIKQFESVRDSIIAGLDKRLITNDDELLSIASISANNDTAIAADVVKIVKTAGEDGLIFLEHNNKNETEILEDKGFIIDQGMLAPDFMDPQTYSANLQNVPVLITDKRLYYAQEAETILRTVLQAGYKEVVIIANDFIGEAVPFFVANHKKGVIKVLLVKDPLYKDNNGATLEDLAVFLGGSVISEKAGSIVDNLTIENFTMADKVFSNNEKTIISRFRENDSTLLDARVAMLKEEIDKLSEGDEKSALSARVASLTNGMVTVKIGGSTGPEMYEKKFRYEDAVNATRSAIKFGYLIGGGMAMYNAVHDKNHAWVNKYTTANVRQIAENSGQSFDLVEYKLQGAQMRSDTANFGFNAKTGQIEDLFKAGVIDPYRVTELAIMNSVSIAAGVISSRYMVVNEPKDEQRNSTTK
jgi:chaperonin GroEL